MVWSFAEGKEAKEKIVLAAKSDRDAGGARGEYFYSSFATRVCYRCVYENH